MTQCIRINSTEHLPLEETLLLHYTILCTGTWDLAQLLTAYRNVCDTGWTVMYPNHQHPRHTDFPITVNTPGVQCTFAWNYGGIVGMDPSDFDEAHSYLTQLSIFNYQCLYTGQEPGLSGTGSGAEPSGGISGDPYGSGYFPGGGPGNGNPEPPTGVRPPIIIPEDPRAGSPASPPSFFGSVSGPVTLFGSFNPELGGLGNIVNSTSPVTNLNSLTDPNQNHPSNREISPNIQLTSTIGTFNQESRSPNISSTPAASFGNTQTFGTSLDINNQIFESNIGIQNSNINNVSTSNRNVSIENYISLRQIVTSSVLPGSFTHIEINQDDIIIGNPLIVSSIFTVPSNISVDATIQVYIIDSRESVYLLGSTYLEDITDSNPLRIAGTFPTNTFGIGLNTVVSLIKDNSNTIIGVSSRSLAIRAATSNLSTSNRSSQIPDILIRAAELNTNSINIPTDRTSNLILSNIDNSYNASAVVRGGESELSILKISDSYISGSLIATSGEVYYSNAPLNINNIPVVPDTHNAGLTTTTSENIIISVHPGNDYRKESLLYISEGYKIQDWNSNVNGSTVNILSPYSNTLLKLLVHGYTSGYINSSYTLYSATSNLTGYVTFTGVNIDEGHYYSVLGAEYNPYQNILHTFLYDNNT